MPVTQKDFKGISQGSKLELKLQEIGEFGNYALSGYAGACDFYTTPLPPSGASGLSGYWVGAISDTGDVSLTWTDNADSETGFNIYRASGSGVYSKVGSVVANVLTFTDHTATTSSVFNYYVESFNSYGAATGSNVFNIITPAPARSPWQNMTSSVWEDWSASVHTPLDIWNWQDWT